MEKTFVLVKPDGVQRGLIGEVIKRLENRGLQLVAAKFLQVSQELAEEHYAAHKEKYFYQRMIQYITSSPVMAMVWQGKNAVAAVRQTMGATNPLESPPGSVRHDFGIDIGRNIAHASDSPESGEKETALWFKPEELVEWDRTLEPWYYE
jgi:nucleoside-diphosphate kinase